MVYEHTWTGSHLSTVQRGLEQSPCEVATFDLTIWSNFPVRFLTSVYAYFSIHFTSSSCLMCFGCLKDHLTTFFSLTTFQKLRRRNLLHWWHADSTVCLLSWLLVQPLHLLCEFMFSIAFQESLSAHLLSPLRLASVPSGPIEPCQHGVERPWPNAPPRPVQARTCCRMRAITSSFSWMARTYSSSSHCAFASTNSRLERSKCDTALDKRRSSARSASAGSSTPPSVLSDMANPLVTSTKRRRRWKCTETTPMQRTKQLEGKRWIDGCHSTDRRTSPTRDS
mmetsp:Transcript_11269/g.69627  ORF Transcript_11269/g.69627 Transcript_11269/m.69627 type:complete len:281 (-) Transcript_11269:1530-2372(-)